MLPADGEPIVLLECRLYYLGVSFHIWPFLRHISIFFYVPSFDASLNKSYAIVDAGMRKWNPSWTYLETLN